MSPVAQGAALEWTRASFVKGGMGNIAFVSFKKNVSDEVFTSMLEGVARSVFKGQALIVPDPCVIALRAGLVEGSSPWAFRLNYFRYGPRKFGCKHPRGGEVAHWIHFVVTAHLCREFNATLSDEGISGTWKDDLYRYPTFKKFLARNLYPSIIVGGGKESRALMKRIFSECPKALRVA